jgi:tetratricopeptide (TPR) repeat protein
VGRDLNNLALLMQDLGDLVGARPLFERSVAVAEAAYGPDDPTVGTRLNNLALLLEHLGQLDEARPRFERALAIAEAAYAPDHPVVGTIRASKDRVLGELEGGRGAGPVQPGGVA